MKSATGLATILLVLIALVHLLRLVFGIEVVAAGRVIPMWVSVLGFIVSGGVAFACWRERRTR